MIFRLISFSFNSLNKIITIYLKNADPSGRAFQGVGLLPFIFWDCGFESRLVHGYLSLVSVVCCQVEVFATGRSLFQRSATEWGVSEFAFETSKMRGPIPARVVQP